MIAAIDWTRVLVILFIASQAFYFLSFLVEIYFFTLPVNWVREDKSRKKVAHPHIVLLYPVLNELESVMRTTMGAIARLDYPTDRFEVVAVPNSNDTDTIASIQRMQADFPFLQMIETPPTSDPSWRAVWDRWKDNPKAYWWHRGVRAGQQDLPPKKTRQLIYAFYTVADARQDGEDFLINYLDADSAPPIDHFMAAAHGMQHYDVLQSTNIAGNLNASMAASLHAFDHMAWDGRKYPHMSANGRHPYWVLGKGLFFRASDLIELGGFNPWITIEDPEVGMRFWKNGRRLGIIAAPLIEEVPETFGQGITQRKRWVAGFWQSLDVPLKEMNFTFGEKLRAWMNFLPCLSLWVNLIGLPIGIWALVTYFDRTSPLPVWTMLLAGINAIFYVAAMVSLYWATWKRSIIVLPRRRDRLWYLLRVNPLFVWLWWGVWLIPLWIGWRMYRRDHGLEWERTEKIDANADLVRFRDPPLIATPIQPAPRQA